MTNEMNDRSSAPRGGRSERSGDLPPRGALENPEVLARATRRRFDAAYKARIVREADACRNPGEVGALLRREGLYSSHLAGWRKQVRQHGVAGLSKKRGPQAKLKPSVREIELERRARKLEKELTKAKAIIEFQKKVHEILGIPLKQHEIEEDD